MSDTYKLSNEQIDAAIQDHVDPVATYARLIQFARAIEAAATAPLLARIAELERDLQFVERWANHHGAKPHVSAKDALSVIQHYPGITAITKGYADGKLPDTPDPFAKVAALERELADASKDAATERELQNAARNLPTDWEIEVTIERDSGVVRLCHEGEYQEFNDPCEGLGGSIQAALRAAIDAVKDKP